MHIEIKALGLELTDHLREYCQRQIVRPLRRIFDRQGPRLEIELADTNGTKGGKDQRCRITYTMPHTRTLTVVEVTDDIYQSVDRAANRFRRLVKKYKGWKLVKTRYPTKYYVARLANRPAPDEAASPEEITLEEDSLAAFESRAFALPQK
ncbi:MAG TPA: HPF/RaiA family ribosome-associated protein [Fredinandcohnia sp.]|nr:HPF/RaiA family ribosome-associated protein [Fredinandcohnia sp.]